MSPSKEPSEEESTSNMFAPIQDLAMAPHESLRLQQRRAPTHMQIDTHFQFPKFLG
jgi:hypothetical protein